MNVKYLPLILTTGSPPSKIAELSFFVILCTKNTPKYAEFYSLSHIPRTREWLPFAAPRWLLLFLRMGHFFCHYSGYYSGKLFLNPLFDWCLVYRCGFSTP
jgi:hypothetical protein